MQQKEIISHIVGWLKNYCDSSGMNGFVIGISGGIDSALTSTLCAMTGKRTLVLTLPIRQHEPEQARADEHIKWLMTKFKDVSHSRTDLTPAFETIEKTFPKEIRDFLSMANSRARLRMLTLYAYAGHHKLLVAGTGNKVEDLGVGFFTKYGDGGVDLSPIADLLKSEVRSLAKELGIVESILVAAPTDGLWPDKRTDEDQLGASYDELEWAMNFQLSGKKEKDLSDRQKYVLDLFLKLNKMNQHKMKPIPVCIIPHDMR